MDVFHLVIVPRKRGGQIRQTETDYKPADTAPPPGVEEEKWRK